MAYKIRIILDVEENVIRDIVVDKNTNLENLHLYIAKSFGFKGQEMASFFRSNDDWQQGAEIPLFDMSDDEQDSIAMRNFSVGEIFKNEGDKLIYVYDFLDMWTFFVELSEIDTATYKKLPSIVFTVGNVPEEAPDTVFKVVKTDENFDDFDSFDNDMDFEDIDDLDLDNY